MNTRSFHLILLSFICAAVTSGAVHAADADAGKSVADRQCRECHEAGDWEGEDAASLAALIRDIVTGKIKHRRALQLSDADIANIAAYWARGRE